MEFLKSAWKNVKELFASKRFKAALAGIVFVVLNEMLGLNISEPDVLKVVGLIATYIAGQSASDISEKKAKIEAGE